ncbi:hypothetical protein ACHAW5_002437 [Stephanodiscus triporus]|uniref:Uncharacterized protein n=1 Tax=Stephanodiscus triporus TaxID=2934178 RepID=A0ABD3NZV5_9STRA
MTGSGAGIDSNISGNMSKGQIGASSIARGGLPYGTSGGMMKGAMSRGIVDGGGSDRPAKTYAKSSLKGFAAAAAKAGPVGGGYLTDLSSNKENGSDGAMMNGNDISAAVGVGGKTSAAPTGVGGEVGSGKGGVLKGTTAAPVNEVKKGYFGKSSSPKLSGKSINNAPPFLSGGEERGGGMFKTTTGNGVGAEKSPAISMANIMKGWTREGGSDSQSTPSGSGSGDGYLPGLVQSKEVTSTSRNPSLSSPLLLVPKGSSPDQQPESPSSQTLINVSATVAEGVGGISKEEQLSQKLKWLQASASFIPQQLPPFQQQQQQQQPQQQPQPQPQQPIGQFVTLTRNTGRIGSATRLGSLASFGIANQGLNNRGGRGVPAGPGAAAVTSGLPPYEEIGINGPSAGGINTGRVESSTAGGGGEGGGGAGRPLSVTITDPRTGKKRTITVSNNIKP